MYNISAHKFMYDDRLVRTSDYGSLLTEDVAAGFYMELDKLVYALLEKDADDIKVVAQAVAKTNESKSLYFEYEVATKDSKIKRNEIEALDADQTMSFWFMMYHLPDRHCRASKIVVSVAVVAKNGDESISQHVIASELSATIAQMAGFLMSSKQGYYFYDHRLVIREAAEERMTS